jgi:hypothetical protein
MNVLSPKPREATEAGCGGHAPYMTRSTWMPFMIIVVFKIPKANREVIDDFQNKECTRTTQNLYRFNLTSLRMISRVMIYQ